MGSGGDIESTRPPPLIAHSVALTSIVAGRADNGLVKERAGSSTMDTAALRKARGAFFTPEVIAAFVADWAIRDFDDRVLEPSCGDAEFLLHAVERLTALSIRHGMLPLAPRVDGVEIHEASAREAQERVISAGGSPEILVSDFFLVEPRGEYAAVIGNPPYIRYQDFAGDARTRSRAAALRGGVPLSGLASSWAAFTVHSALFLRKGGRMGLVLPAELLSVNYAGAVRKFLFDRFKSVDLVLFNERVFPEAETDVVLLLADGFDEGPTDHARVVQAQNAEALTSLAVSRKWTPIDPADKWTPSLLGADVLSAYSGLLTSGNFVGLESWGDTTLGMVTGNNRYFALSTERVRELKLTDADLINLSPPGSSHLRGLTFGTRALNEMARKGSPVYLFRPRGEPSDAALIYIEAGETAGVNQAYKCRVRKPWWRVPIVAPADLLLTYMNADTPRLTTNDANAHHLNSVHGVYLKPELRKLGRRLLPLASLTSMTLLGAETVGRSYGGGILKIEPREADVLPVPAPEVVAACAEKLAALRPQVSTLLRNSRLTDAAKLVDEVVLIGELGLKRADVKLLRDAHAEYSARRSTRSQHVQD
jgi:adenine-specific DNA methylase